MTHIGPKIKSTQNLLKFGPIDISNIPISILISEIIFIKFEPLVLPKLIPKLSAQNLLKFGTFDIANMPIWILMSKMGFMTYLSAARPS